jgi:hypothetical protein
LIASSIVHFGLKPIGLGVLLNKFSFVENCKIYLINHPENDDDYLIGNLLKSKRKIFVNDLEGNLQNIIHIETFYLVKQYQYYKQIFLKDEVLFVSIDFSNEFARDFMDVFFDCMESRNELKIDFPVILLLTNQSELREIGDGINLMFYIELLFRPVCSNVLHIGNIIYSIYNPVYISNNRDVVVEIEQFGNWIVDTGNIQNAMEYESVRLFLNDRKVVKDETEFNKFYFLQKFSQLVLKLISYISYKTNEPQLKIFINESPFGYDFLEYLIVELTLIFNLKDQWAINELTSFKNLLQKAEVNIFYILPLSLETKLKIEFYENLLSELENSSLGKIPFSKISLLRWLQSALTTDIRYLKDI